jgi:hypothetical protein
MESLKMRKWILARYQFASNIFVSLSFIFPSYGMDSPQPKLIFCNFVANFPQFSLDL